jgi:hypothetical protein
MAGPQGAGEHLERFREVIHEPFQPTSPLDVDDDVGDGEQRDADDDRQDGWPVQDAAGNDAQGE